MRKNVEIFKRLLYFVLVVSIAGCSTNSLMPQSVPERDIIFQSTMIRWPYDLNFIQSDGLSHQVLTIEENFIKPFWSSNGEILYGLSNPVGQPFYEDMGYPAYWDIKTGIFKKCTKNLPYFGQIESYKKTDNQNEVLLYNVSEIIIFDLETCEKKVSVVDFTNHTGDYAISGISYFPETQELLYGRYTVPFQEREYRLIRRNLRTGEQIELEDGINPAWSPDGKQIAYLGLNGLYIIEANGKKVQQIINGQFFDPDSVGGPSFSAPQPRWSPNGEWLVYHKCIDRTCDVKQTPIYKVRVSDGWQEEIVIGGKFPTWRP